MLSHGEETSTHSFNQHIGHLPLSTPLGRYWSCHDDSSFPHIPKKTTNQQLLCCDKCHGRGWGALGAQRKNIRLRLKGRKCPAGGKWPSNWMGKTVTNISIPYCYISCIRKRGKCPGIVNMCEGVVSPSHSMKSQWEEWQACDRVGVKVIFERLARDKAQGPGLWKALCHFELYLKDTGELLQTRSRGEAGLKMCVRKSLCFCSQGGAQKGGDETICREIKPVLGWHVPLIMPLKQPWAPWQRAPRDPYYRI